MSTKLHSLWEIIWLLPITSSLLYLWIDFAFFERLNQYQFQTTLLFTIMFNMLDIFWILFNPSSFINGTMLIIIHHLCVILIAIAVYNASYNYQITLYVCLPYVIEINTILRDIFKIFDQGSILYYICILLWDISWIPCRVILLPSISIWSLFTIKNYIIPFGLLPLSVMNLYWTRFWIKSVGKRYFGNKAS